MLREVSFAIELATCFSPIQFPRADNMRTPAVCRNPHTALTKSASAHTSAARSESVVMPHDQLRLDLRHRIHRHAHHDQQRRSAEIKGDAQTIRHPGGRPFKERAQRPYKMIQVDAGNHPLGNERNDDQVQRAHQSDARQNFVDVIRCALAGRMPGINPPYFRMLSATSFGLKTIEI